MLTLIEGLKIPPEKIKGVGERRWGWSEERSDHCFLLFLMSANDKISFRFQIILQPFLSVKENCTSSTNVYYLRKFLK